MSAAPVTPQALQDDPDAESIEPPSVDRVLKRDESYTRPARTVHPMGRSSRASQCICINVVAEWIET